MSSTKSHDIAVQQREAGNKCYLKKQYAEALRLYTECILHAPQNGCTSELALGYGNRSALFFQIEDYKNCLSDARLALGHGYTRELQYRLHQRCGQSYVHLHQTKLAETEFNIAKKMITQSDMDSQKRDKLLKEIEILIDTVQRKSDDGLCSSTVNVQKDVTSSPSTLLQPVYGFGSVLLEASSAVDMVYSKDKGRYLVANRPITAGDVVIVERPYAGVLLPTHYDVRCQHCFSQLIAAVPCHQCCTVRYCSEECRATSWNMYHSTECLLDGLLQSIGVAHLCLRLVLVTGLSRLIELQNDLKLRTSSDLSDNSNPIESVYTCNYDSVYQLLPHSDDMHAEDLVQYALTASLLLKCLEMRKFFTSIESVDLLSSVKSFVGGLLLRHVCQLVCNAHAITDCELTQISPTSLVDTVSQVRVATAIYPTASLMNHSCDPTIISSFQNDVLIVRATKDVAPGEEIFNCYGPHCKRMSWRERQKHLLDQYFFTCTCSACAKEHKLDLCFKALKCPRCEGPLVTSSTIESVCLDCGHTVIDTSSQKRAVLESDQLFIGGLQHLQNNSIDDALRLFQKCFDLRRHNVYRHNKDLSEVEDALARCHASKGNFTQAKDLLHQSVNTTEVIYGKTSIELANELHKYAEVCYQAEDRADALNAVERAISVFTLNYGQDCTQITELKEFKQHLVP